MLPWLHSATPNGEVLAFVEADWIVAFNDWTSLLLATAFLFAAFLNFATLGQLWLAFRDQWEAGILTSLMPTAREDVGLGIPDENPSAVRAVGGGTCFAVFSKPCAKLE